MKVKCSWCGSWINEYDETCPNCGGKNENFKRQGTGVPRTIEELKAWAKQHNLPLRQMRTYIGENHTGAKAFGIYKDENTGNFVVYKNKADGTRAVRYEGPDEAYAVNELYLKMKERVTVQKSSKKIVRPKSGQTAGRPKGPVYLNTGNPVGYENKRDGRGTEKSTHGVVIQAVVFVAVACLGVLLSVFFLIRPLTKKPSTGYYRYNDSMYYRQDSTDDWYIYDYDADRWNTCRDDLDELYDNYDDYRVYGYTYYDVTDFTESGYYVAPSSDSDSSWDSDWDDDYDWDSGSDWDSGYDDWDSDW